MFSCDIPNILRICFLKNTSGSASVSSDVTSTCKSLFEVQPWGQVQRGYFGMYVTVTLFNREKCYRKHMEKKIHESDEHVFFLTAVF